MLTIFRPSERIQTIFGRRTSHVPRFELAILFGTCVILALNSVGKYVNPGGLDGYFYVFASNGDDRALAVFLFFCPGVTFILSMLNLILFYVKAPFGPQFSFHLTYPIVLYAFFATGWGGYAALLVAFSHFGEQLSEDEFNPYPTIFSAVVAFGIFICYVALFCLSIASIPRSDKKTKASENVPMHNCRLCGQKAHVAQPDHVSPPVYENPVEPDRQSYQYEDREWNDASVSSLPSRRDEKESNTSVKQSAFERVEVQTDNEMTAMTRK